MISASPIKTPSAAYVRWLGAYRDARAGVEAAVAWETTQAAREVAVEPLWRGRSLILAERSAVWIGLAVDWRASRFVAGYQHDCWSAHQAGRLAPESKIRPIRDQDRFRGGWARRRPRHHGEAHFDAPKFCAVAVRYGATRDQMDEAHRIAAGLGLPVIQIREADVEWT